MLGATPCGAKVKLASNMDTSPRRRCIDVLLFDGVNVLDVTGPVQAFDVARFNGKRVYSTRFLCLSGNSVTASCGLVLGAEGTLADAHLDSDFLIPGGAGIDTVAARQDLQDHLRQRQSRPGDSRLISICSGALALAKAGILDGRPASTHWSRAAQLAAYPKVCWDLDRIFTLDRRLYTSAGVTAGLDLALAIIREDCGGIVALQVARDLVVQLRRTGGQNQYATYLAAQFTEDEGLARLIECVVSDPGRAWTRESLADTAHMSSRTLARRFKEHLAMTPTEFVERTRVERARVLISEHLPLKAVATKSGFGDLQRLRRAFQRQLNTDPTSYAAIFSDGQN